MRFMIRSVAVLAVSAMLLAACNEQTPQPQTQTVTNQDGTQSQVPVQPAATESHWLRDGAIGAAIGYFIGRSTAPRTTLPAGQGGFTSQPQGSGVRSTTTVNRTVNQTVINKTTIIQQKPDAKPSLAAPGGETTPHPPVPPSANKVVPSPKQQAQAQRASPPARSAPSSPARSSGGSSGSRR